MLDPCLDNVLLAEVAHKTGVPELGGYPQVLAAAHQGVGFAAFDGRGQSVGTEIIVLALSLSDEATVCQQKSSKWYEGNGSYRPAARRTYSRVTMLLPTTGSPLGTRAHPMGPKTSFNFLLYLISGRYTTPSGLTSISSTSMGSVRLAYCSSDTARKLAPE